MRVCEYMRASAMRCRPQVAAPKCACVRVHACTLARTTHWHRYSVGYMYQSGHGVPPDHAKAICWYRKAAEQGHVRAQSSLEALCHGHSSMVEIRS